MRRREFIALLGGVAAAWPVAARAQQAQMPVVAFINGGAADAASRYLAAFRKGLREAGYVEGQNVTVEYYWLDGRYEGIPALMADLVRRQVALIATPGSNVAFQGCDRDDPDCLRLRRRPGQTWPCRELRAAGQQCYGRQFFRLRGYDQAARAPQGACAQGCSHCRVDQSKDHLQRRNDIASGAGSRPRVAAGNPDFRGRHG